MMRAALIALALTGLASAAGAGERDARHLVVIAGIGGEPFYDELFDRWATTLIDLSRDAFDMDPRRVDYLAGDEASARAHGVGISDRESIRATMARVVEASRPGDLVLVVLIGHGTARGEDVLFNIPGPDLSAGEFAALLDAMPDRRIAVVDVASASGAFVPLLSRPGRVVITATASGSENLHPRFGGYFVTAFTAEADTDKDGRVSLLEAFAYSTARVGKDFEREQRVRTEHALLDDNGDGAGSRLPGEGSADGAVAAAWFLARDASHTGDGAARALAARGQRLADRVGELGRRKLQISASAYEAELESLLVELALTRRALRTVEGQ